MDHQLLALANFHIPKGADASVAVREPDVVAARFHADEIHLLCLVETYFISIICDKAIEGHSSKLVHKRPHVSRGVHAPQLNGLNDNIFHVVSLAWRESEVQFIF